MKETYYTRTKSGTLKFDHNTRIEQVVLRKGRIELYFPEPSGKTVLDEETTEKIRELLK